MFKKDKPLSFFALWIMVFLFIRFIGYYTAFPDTIFPKICWFVTKLTTRFTSLFSFSMGDILYTIMSIVSCVFVFKLFIKIKSKKWVEMRKLISYFIISATFFMFIFYFFWGFNYYKTTIKEDYDTEKISLEELKSLAEHYLAESIELRENTTQDEKGIFKFSVSEEKLNDEISVSFREIIKINELKYIHFIHPNLKKSLYSKGFSYMGILGYYNPFTSEAQYNSKMPDTKLLFTQFHEVAHQWGFAYESEANFVGFLIGSKSENIEFRYVSNYKALRSLLNKLVWEDPKFVESMLNRYSPKMKKDRAYEIEIQKKYAHTADDAFSMLNEAYLQLNNQDGLASYGQFVELLVGYHRKHPIDLQGNGVFKLLRTFHNCFSGIIHFRYGHQNMVSSLRNNCSEIGFDGSTSEFFCFLNRVDCSFGYVNSFKIISQRLFSFSQIHVNNQIFSVFKSIVGNISAY